MAAVGCFWVLWVVLKSGLLWAAVGCLGCFGLLGLLWAALGCFGLLGVVLDCFGMFWVALGCSIGAK